MALIFSEISLLTTVVKEEQEAAATFFFKVQIDFLCTRQIRKSFFNRFAVFLKKEFSFLF